MTRRVIEIDETLCDGCGQCVPNCMEGALQIVDGKARLVGDLLCDGLGACIGNCPRGAISFVEREAEAYDEATVVDQLSQQGEAALVSHLRHLKEHGQKDLVHQGFARLAEKGWDVASLRNQVLATVPSSEVHSSGGGCPGSRIRDLTPSAPGKGPSSSNDRANSALRQWPVQLRLVPPTAPFLQNCDLLVSADCVPFADPNFHRDLLEGRVLLIGCPKLDDNDAYAQKLAIIFRENRIRSVTVARMEVPCCGGIVEAVRRAVTSSGKVIPIAEVVVSIEGGVKSVH